MVKRNGPARVRALSRSKLIYSPTLAAGAPKKTARKAHRRGRRWPVLSGREGDVITGP
jgi:hypothetical protein